MTLLLSLLLACGTSDPAPEEAAPDGAATPAEPAAAAPPVEQIEPGPDDELLYEVLLAHPTEAVSGVRVWSNGAVEEPVGTPIDPRWTGTRALAGEEVDIVRRLLATPEMEAVPAVLPATLPTDGQPTRALWRLRKGDDLRGVRSDAHLSVRVPVLERVESLLRGNVPASYVHARWQVSYPDVVKSTAMPCDPTQALATRGVATTLLDPELPKAPPSEAELLLRIDWFSWPTSWQAELLGDGTVRRTDWEGRVTTWKLPAQQLASIDGAVHRLPWQDFRSLCAP